MAVTKSCLEYTTVADGKDRRVYAIIVCGGSSTRMNGVDKMFAEIGGVPVIVKTVSAFQKCRAVTGIVIVTRNENLLRIQQLCNENEFSKVTDIVEGGVCREESAMNGLIRVGNDADYVLVHDGARPFVTENCIMRVIEGAEKFSAVTCAVKLKDTVKSVRSDGMVTATPDRNLLVSVQTPQGFALEVYKSAMEACRRTLDKFTDDCSVVESNGCPVYIVDGEYSNIKITTADDLKYADYIVRGKDND